jgi:hypothetical protein
MAVKSGWKSSEEKLAFWSTGQGEEEKRIKLLLKKNLQLAGTIFCLNCNMIKEGLNFSFIKSCRSCPVSGCLGSQHNLSGANPLCT